MFGGKEHTLTQHSTFDNSIYGARSNIKHLLNGFIYYSIY